MCAQRKRLINSKERLSASRPLGGSLLCLHGGERSSQLGDSGRQGDGAAGQGLSLRAVLSLASLRQWLEKRIDRISLLLNLL